MYASEYYLMMVILDMHVSSNFCLLFVSFPEEIDFIGSVLFKLQIMTDIPEKDGHFFGPEMVISLAINYLWL